MSQLIAGIIQQDVEVEGRQRPALVVKDSRKRQFFAFAFTLGMAVAAYFMYFDAENADLPIIGHSPQLSRIFAVFGCLFMAAMALMFLVRLFRPLEYLALTPEGITSTHTKPAFLLPWESIAEVGLSGDGQQRGVMVRLAAPEQLALPEARLKKMRALRAQTGWDWGLSVNLFAVPEALLEALLHYYATHPEKRAAIGPQTNLDFLPDYAKELKSRQPSTPPIPSVGSSVRESSHDFTENLFDPSQHDELFDEELQQAIEAVAKEDNAATRRRVYEALLKTTFCVPSSGGDGDSRTITLTKNEADEVVMVAFTDPPALRRWTETPQSLLVLTAPRLCEMAQENNFPEILINPAGPAGGKLTRAEIACLARGVIPDSVLE